jgi:serine-type D-Ala-D-Ala carboxypeptidase (penicillin-binding protein 5/6)
MIRNFLRILLFAIPTLIYAPAYAEPMGSELQKAEFYFLIDADTREVLLSRNADIRIAPSSMTKLMTAYVVFDQIAKGHISFENQCLIGKDAWRKYGSSMFLNYGDVVSIEDLIKGLLVVSGNDAAIALAETTAGGLENFVDLMNLKAKELGLKNSHFRNPHGLNEENHYMSLRDLATLTVNLYKDFPQYSHFFNMPEFTYHRITQHNRNPLIKNNYDGVIGGKTGHTNQGGYGVVGVVKRDHRRLIAVVNKAKTPKQRTVIITELLDYGFNNYKKLILFEKDQTVANLKTWLGRKSQLSASTNREIAFNIPRDKSIDTIKVRVKYRKPLYAPITRGAKVGELVIEVPGYNTFKYSLFAKETIEKVGYLRRINRVLRYKISNIFNPGSQLSQEYKTF